MIIHADARQIPLADQCVQCCVTSPPYFGLRDYGHAGQIGLEPSPDAYVAQLVQVFREVRRVLKDDGVLWLNLGDSYNSAKGNPGPNSHDPKQPARRGWVRPNDWGIDGFKPKDLLGIPWRVAFALQQPYYAGSIRSREDRIWLAAMLDAEGCMFIHKRKAGQANGQGYYRKHDNYGPGVEICNTSRAVVERIHAIVGKGSICTSDKGRHGRKQTLYRWNLRTTESRDFVRELYPHLIAKQQQARILCGCPSSGERADAAHAALIALHNGIESDVDFPAPASMFEPGWYLRSDVIWAKRNPMPESVTDRPTKAHEYLFLLAKSERYFYDAAAIKEPAAYGGGQLGIVQGLKRRAVAMGVKPSGNERPGADAVNPLDRNKRSVWTVPAMPYSGAHFATMPEKLVEPCILAGSRLGDRVLDPFCGSGTVGAVAERLGRRWVGLDLNPAYHQLAKTRTAQRGLRFEEATV